MTDPLKQAREALHAMMQGCEYRTLQGIAAWHSKQMPSDAALDAARAAIASIDAHIRAEQIGHIYNGDCPNEQQPDSRDPKCPACVALTQAGAAIDAQQAAPDVEMVRWPQVVAYPGGSAPDCGAWVDISNGDGPEHVHRYIRAQQAAPVGTPRDYWPTDAAGASGHLAGLAFGAASSDEIGHCVGILRDLIETHAATPPAVRAPAPLTEAQIQAAFNSVDMRHPRGDATRNAFARAIERAHGIGAAAQGGE